MNVFECVVIRCTYILFGFIALFLVNLTFKSFIGRLHIHPGQSFLPEAMLTEGFSPRLIGYNRCDPFQIGQSSRINLTPSTLTKLKQLGIFQYRGTRGGISKPRKWETNEGVNINNLIILSQAIEPVIHTTPTVHKNETQKSGQLNKNLRKIKCENQNVTKGQTQLKLCCINPRSVKNKTLSLRDFIISNDLDIVAVTETWLGTSLDKTCIGELLPNGYQIKHVPRGSSKNGGGVALIFKSSIDVSLKSSSIDNDFSTFEHMDCTVMIESYSLRLAVVYRPPPSKKNCLKTSVFLNQELPSFLERYATENKHILIVGDFNIHVDKRADPNSLKFNGLLESFGLQQHVSEPTHVSGHTLDLLITRASNKTVSNVSVTDPGLCDKNGKVSKDHLAVISTVYASKPPPVTKTVTFRKLRSIDVEEFKKDILSSDKLNSCFNSTNVNDLADAYNHELLSLIDKHAPRQSKTIVLRPSCPWYTEELHAAKHLRRKLERKWRKTKLAIDHEIYRNQCALVNQLLRTSKEKYYSDKVKSCGRDQKGLFRITKHLLGDVNEVLLPSNKSPKIASEDFSDFFHDKVKDIRLNLESNNHSLSSKVYEENSEPAAASTLNIFAPTTDGEVKRIIEQSPNKSCELDPIPTWLLKNCLNELLPVLTKIVNTSLETATVPTAFKISHIKPHLKKHGLDKNTLKNYRPVSNLPFVSKILEKIVDMRVEQHLMKNNLHEENQSAYRKLHSTETALLKVQNDILNSLDTGNVTLLVLLDLSAAFDTIDHSVLLDRLENLFGITGKPLQWMKSYLHDRFQIVCVAGEQSEAKLLKFGVPQGSVLGPKNYTMYTKPVGSICRGHGIDHHFYADDSQLYLSFKPTDDISQMEAIDKMEACLKDITIWMQRNKLKLNADKTEVILFSSKHNASLVDNITVKVENCNVKPSPSARNLGAQFDSQLDMEHHVNSISKSCYMKLRQIGHIRKFLTVDATKSLINSLITSRLDYCNSLLYRTPNAITNKLQNVQNTAARIITKTSKYDHITPILKDLHWLPVQYRIQFKILTQTFKALSGKSPSYMKNMIEVYVPRRNLRSRDGALRLKVPKSKTVKFGERSFSSAAPMLWNALPDTIRDCENLSSFKKMLKTHLFKQAYNTAS